MLDGVATLAGLPGAKRAVPRVEAAPDQPGPGRDRVNLSPEACAKCDLDEQEQREIRELQQRDRSVRAHEQAHKAAAGPHAGPVSYSYTTGPDGRRYAVSGEVPIDVSPVEGDPQATIDKMQQVRRAALSPAEPSDADRQVAARAQELERAAQAELAARREDPHASGTEPGQLIDVTA